MSDTVTVTQADIDCFKAIFGFTDDILDPQGDDRRTLATYKPRKIIEAQP